MSEANHSIEYARSQSDRYLAELKDFVSIPSISTLVEHKPDMQRAADWVAGQLKAFGMEHVQIMPTAGHSVVYADWLKAPGKQTILVYGHYDVQPADPLDEWVTPPFEPTVRGDNL